MKRRNAILLFGFMSLAVVGYAAWGARVFLLKPGIVFDPDVPDAARAVIRGWHDSDRFATAERFTWQAYLGRLQNPWQKGSVPVTVRLIRGGGIYVQHGSRPAVGWEFAKANEEWMLLNEVVDFEIRERERAHLRDRGGNPDLRVLDRAAEPADPWSKDF
jgi:hypothetical protein